MQLYSFGAQNLKESNLVNNHNKLTKNSSIKQLFLVQGQVSFIMTKVGFGEEYFCKLPTFMQKVVYDATLKKNECLTS